MVNKPGNRFPGRIIHIIRKHNGLFFVVIAIVLILTLFIFADRGFLHFYNSYNEREILKKEIETLEQKRDTLLQEKNKLENDPEYIEKIAREKYKMKKKDEKVYKVEMEKDE